MPQAFIFVIFMAMSLYSAGSSSAQYVAPNRSVSFWYAPSSSDVDQIMNVLSSHRDAVTSVMLYCGHSVDIRGILVGSVSKLCDDGKGGGIIPTLKKLGIGAEFVVNDGSTNVTAHKLFMANVTAVTKELVTIGKKYGIYGWNLDLEPQKVPGKVSDAIIYANFCSILRKQLNANGIRLTIDVASWSPMLKQFTLLAPTVDRLMNMETYNANSMHGWIHGDLYGGYYDKFVNSDVPRISNGVGLGSWPTAKCGQKPCWSTTSASAAPRMTQIEQDNVPEVALFRLYGDQSNTTSPDKRWPEDWWWAPLAKYLSPSSSSI